MKTGACIMLIFSLIQVKGQNRDALIAPMGFFDLNIGLDARINSLRRYDSLELKGYYGSKTPSSLSSDRYLSSYFGISAKMQNSFIATFFKDKMKRFVIGDLLSAELSAGYANSKLREVKTGIWATYRIEFGAGAIYRLNANNDLGLKVFLLRFNRDLLSPDLFGSSIFLKYRYRRLWLEGGIESGRKLYGGWLYVFSEEADPWQLSITGKYLLPGRKNIGIRVENFPKNQFSNNLYTELGEEILWTVKLFYGIYF